MYDNVRYVTIMLRCVYIIIDTACSMYGSVYGIRAAAIVSMI